MQNKKFVFLITDGSTLLPLQAWGESRHEAESYLRLNHAWSLVKDEVVIRNFIASEKAEVEVDLARATGWVARQLESYNSDLVSLSEMCSPVGNKF